MKSLRWLWTRGIDGPEAQETSFHTGPHWQPICCGGPKEHAGKSSAKPGWQLRSRLRQPVSLPRPTRPPLRTCGAQSASERGSDVVATRKDQPSEGPGQGSRKVSGSAANSDVGEVQVTIAIFAPPSAQPVRHCRAFQHIHRL